MKVLLYMAITVDGFIAANDDSANFLTPLESATYVKAVLETGALIIGRRTYEILSTQPEFQEFLKGGVRIVALSQGTFELKSPNHAIAASPQEALKLLETEDRVIVAGGGKTNSAFLEQGLIDEIYLDVEPAVIGQGIKLFNGSALDIKLELLGTNRLSENEIQLHYRVVR